MRYFYCVFHLQVLPATYTHVVGFSLRKSKVPYSYYFILKPHSLQTLPSHVFVIQKLFLLVSWERCEWWELLTVTIWICLLDTMFLKG